MRGGKAGEGYLVHPYLRAAHRNRREGEGKKGLNVPDGLSYSSNVDERNEGSGFPRGGAPFTTRG